MRRLFRYLLLAAMLFSPQVLADTSLGEVNIELRGNVVDISCYVTLADATKTVDLGRWPTKQLPTAGSATPQVPFTLQLAGCPPGSASITFSGAAANGTSLLALNDSAMAQKVAIELRDKDRLPLALEKASQPVTVDSGGNATLQFYANYIALVDNPSAGSAKADATFTINYY